MKKMGADIVISFDICTPFSKNKVYTKKSLQLTNRWNMRTYLELKNYYKTTQAMLQNHPNCALKRK